MKVAREAGHCVYLSYDKLIVMDQQRKKNANICTITFEEADWCGGHGPTVNSWHSAAVTMVVWNIDGLMSRLEDPQLITYLK